MTKGLYRFEGDCGRSGVLSGVFIATAAEVDKTIGKRIYFGEVLGKHSDIEWDLEAEELELLNVPHDAVVQLEEALGETISGINPVATYREQEEEAMYED